MHILLLLLIAGVNEIVHNQVQNKEIENIDYLQAILNYNKAIGMGILKVMNKIGISTLNSYRGAQLFECIGLNTKVVDEYFPNTITRIQGIGLKEIESEISKRHKKAYEKNYGVKFIELSCVGDGAFESCEIQEIYDVDDVLDAATNIEKKANEISANIILAHQGSPSDPSIRNEYERW